MGADPSPELTTNEEWRAIATRARKELGWTQEELGRRVGTSQNMISNIESGKVESSTFIAAICKELSIPFPRVYENEEDKEWSQIGHLLRHKNMRQFRRALELVKSMVEEEQAANEDAAEQPPRK